MNKLLVLCFAMILSCTNAVSQKSTNGQQKGEILVSESQGGTEEPQFSIITNEQQFQTIIKKNFENAGREPILEFPKYPIDKKLVLYSFGRFNSGDHKLKVIKNITVKNNILYIEIPEYRSGGMEIQVISNPWSIIAVPANLKFNSVELLYSK